MVMNEVLTGQTKLETLDSFEKKVLEEIDKIEKIENKEKVEKAERKLRKKLVRFFENLERLGVEVYLDKRDGGQQIKEYEDFEEISLREVYKKYVLATLKEIKKEIDRRIENEEY